MTMGCFDGAEVCELVGTYALSKLSEEFDSADIGLYRDDGLAVIRDATGSTADRTRKTICQIFTNLGLKLTISAGMKTVDFLDVTLHLSTGKYQPYRKPNNKPVYVHQLSNHPPAIIQQLPKTISRRLTDISSDRHIFEESAPAYNDALRESGYVERVEYMEERKEETGRRKKNRRRNITWYNPPFSKNVATDIAHKFLRLLDTHFPHGCRLRQIFNRNNVKVSYSCMPNMSAIVKSHNNHVQRKRQTQDKNVRDKRCNCRDKSTCPMDGDCQVRCIVYKATVQHTGR